MRRNPRRSPARTVARLRGLTPRMLILALVSPLASLMPLYMVAALASQLDAEVGLTLERLSLATAAYFLAAALAVQPAGRLATRLGSVATMQVGVGLSALVLVLAGALATSWVHIMACLIVCGGLQAFVDPASGTYLTRALPPAARGLAFGMKLAAIPVGAMLCGLAVPLVAGPFGWRWVFIGCGFLLGLAALVRPRYRPSEATEPRRSDKLRIDPLLGRLMVGVAAGFTVANVFTAFIVSSAHHAGMSAGSAGFLFAAGGTLGALGRVQVGHRASGSAAVNLWRTEMLILASGVGCLLLMTGSAPLHWIVIPTGFIAVWVWAPLYQLTATSFYEASPAAALRRINSLIYGVSVVGPLLFGLVAARSFAWAWLAAGLLALAAVAALDSARRLVDDELGPGSCATPVVGPS